MLTCISFSFLCKYIKIGIYNLIKQLWILIHVSVLILLIIKNVMKDSQDTFFIELTICVRNMAT